jgi:L-alanine-DL-glutamate epimerase-like enolase superfamily enzyme
MKITNVYTEKYRWPKEKPIANGKHVYTHNELNLLCIDTDEGITGYGCSWSAKAVKSNIPLAAGENENTRFGYRDLIASQAVSILNPDAETLGGITEFMKIAAMADAHGLDISPHGQQQVHVHCVYIKKKSATTA